MTQEAAATPSPPLQADLAQNTKPAPSQALMLREDDGSGLALGERLLHGFYRYSWGTPLGRMVARPKEALRLLDVPDDPLPGNIARGTAIRAGYFRHYGMKQPIAGIDFLNLKLPPSFCDYVHSFAWVRDLAAAAPAPQVRADAVAIAKAWLNQLENPDKSGAWRPDIAGWRILNWTAGAPLILGGQDKAFRSRMLHIIARTASILDRTAPKAAAGEARVVAWCGTVAASLMLPGGKPRRIFGEAGLIRALDNAIGEDGGVLSRAPLVQYRLIGALTMLASLYRKRDIAIPARIAGILGRMVPALQGITHQDGSLAGWQGAPALTAAMVDPLVQASGIIARPTRQAHHWGYQRIPAGKTVVLVDAGTPPTTRNSAIGCASTLAFEMSVGEHRMITSCGGAAAIGSVITAKLSQGLRATAAHSTLCLDDMNSTAVLPKGQLGRGVENVEVNRREVDHATRLEMSHDGYLRSANLIHKRILMVRDDGSELRGEDALLPAEKARKKRRKAFSAKPFAIRFHLGTAVDPHLTSDGKAAILRLPDGRIWQLRAAQLTISLEDSLWVDGDARVHPGKQLVLQGEIGVGGGSFSWILKAMQ